ncbi:hypothetical protein Anapl_07465 [Anas platyrhynchos]|uniref:Uncharacterized protein n=1 Tax=Anas platyrhynchos TaxID=8839 RepID=R0LI87_ANAPL|nr:hypothetical protein Anapl_07465 [Anas platyrhynchos]
MTVSHEADPTRLLSVLPCSRRHGFKRTEDRALAKGRAVPCSCRGGTATRRGGVCSVPWLLRHLRTPLGNGPPAGFLCNVDSMQQHSNKFLFSSYGGQKERRFGLGLATAINPCFLLPPSSSCPLPDGAAMHGHEATRKPAALQLEQRAAAQTLPRPPLVHARKHWSCPATAEQPVCIFQLPEQCLKAVLLTSLLLSSLLGT